MKLKTVASARKVILSTSKIIGSNLSTSKKILRNRFSVNKLPSEKTDKRIVLTKLKIMEKQLQSFIT